jgi:hydroxymethylglutaryl-CoA lyase
MAQRRWPKVEYREEAMREGMQIEDANIPVEDKVALIEALAETGLKTIVIGSFVSPRYTPQMARIEEVVSRLKPPPPGVKYTALVAPGRYQEQARKYSPPLTLEREVISTSCHLCDVFVRRNWNRTQEDEINQWPQVVARAQEAGVKQAGIGLGAAWGSNFVGEFTQEHRMAMLERQYRLWEQAGIPVTHVSLADPMSWCRPDVVEAQLWAIKERWPSITTFYLHLHNARGMALPSAYAALRVLDPDRDTLAIDGTLGGVGGCPYCGNGRATGQMPTEDVMHMLQDMGIDMGVDLDKLVECVWMLEEVIGRPTLGHVSKAGPRPTKERLYDPNAPFIETFEQAKHFLKGPRVYEGGIYPWREPIRSPMRPDTMAPGQPQR